jgi:hypothetical protein
MHTVDADEQYVLDLAMTIPTVVGACWWRRN